MAAVVPTAAEVRKQACGRPKIVEALQLLGVDAHHKMGAKALKAQLLQLMPTGHAGPTTVGRHQLLCALDARPARAFAARRAIDKQLATVRACLRDGEALPDKLHRAVRSCLAADDPGRRDAMLGALQARRCRTWRRGPTSSSTAH